MVTTMQIIYWTVAAICIFPGLAIGFYFEERALKKKLLSRLPVYKLKKSRVFFWVYKRKEGKIEKGTFWLWIAYYIFLLTFLSLWIPLLIFRLRTLLIIIYLIIITLPVMLIIAAACIIGHHSKNYNPFQSYVDDAQEERAKPSVPNQQSNALQKTKDNLANSLTNNENTNDKTDT